MEANTANQTYLLAINAGSSSIKLAVFSRADMGKVADVVIDNIGQDSACLVVAGRRMAVAAADHRAAAAVLLDWLASQTFGGGIVAVGHRVVHGGPQYYKAHVVTPKVIADLRQLAIFDPQHMLSQLDLLETFQRLLPNARHIVCFDTAFHHALPNRSRLLPVPRQLAAAGVRRYGFHGLSYAFILHELERVEGKAAANGKVIIAHLGSGASLAAVHEGRSIDTTMSMTPASGIPMSTRSGDLDPGLLYYVHRTQGYDADRLQHMVQFESGLLGLSGVTADMKRLLEIEADNPHAKDAVDVFCYQVSKTIGAFAAALGGLHTLVFTGGMGENAPKIRARVCQDLAFLGITLDVARNERGERLISADGGLVGVHVIHTDEAATIAREVQQLIKDGEHQSS